MKQNSIFNSFSIGLITLWLFIFALIPNFLVLVVSVLKRSNTNFVESGFTLSAYGNFFEPMYFSILVNSFYMALTTTVVCILIGYPFAYILARSTSKYKGMLALLVVLPYWTSALIRTYAIKVILTNNGIINTILIKIGVISAPLNLLYTEGAVILGLVYTLLPFMILPLYAAIDKLDFRYVEAAYDLGANKFQTFFWIVIPLTIPGIIAGSLLVFLPSLGLFYIPDILGGAKNIMIGNLIRDQFLTARNWPFGAAASNILTLVMAIMLMVYYKSVKKINNKVL